jgi:formate hydrogenlyase transcriptional activator
MASSKDRYRTLLNASYALPDQPTVKAVLHSVRGVLSSTCSIHGIHLYVLGEDGNSLRVLEFDREPDAPPITTGTKISCTGAAAQALEGRQPVFLEDVSQEMFKHTALARFAPESIGRSTYLFPLATSEKQHGVLVMTKDRGQEFVTGDAELLRALASHVELALECALTRDAAERYRRELAKERDRLSLLLEIDNEIVNKGELGELFHSVAAAIRQHFGNDTFEFWFINRGSGKLERRFLDFSNGAGLLEKVSVATLGNLESESWRIGTPRLSALHAMSYLTSPSRDTAKAETFACGLSVPLVGIINGPLGLIHMSSRNENAFSQSDADFVSQIGKQISLALDKSIRYGGKRESRENVEHALQHLESELSSGYDFEGIIGDSAAMRRVFKEISIVAPTDCTVLLHGETGTGKELVARAIHNRSARRDRPFVRLNCAAIPSGLLESELFGHEKGAFTGAVIQKKGRFEAADHGSLFLDEIGDIGLDLQPKLLRALQEQEFERLGSTRTIRVDVRIVAATHRNLDGMIRDGKFREDLFYRLNVFPIEIPPLRERREDIPLLVNYFVARLSRRMGKNIDLIREEAMKAIADASWSGNVRELENFLERAVILTEGNELHVPIGELKSGIRSAGIHLVSKFHDIERETIIDALKASSGRVAGGGGAAERLGLKRTTLQAKMRRLKIARSDYAA